MLVLLLTTILFIQALLGKGEAPASFILAITLWLWFTLFFANFAEAWRKDAAKHKRKPYEKHDVKFKQKN